MSCVECSSRRSTRSAALGDVSSLGMVSVDNFPSDELQASFLLIVSSQVMAGTASCDFELVESTILRVFSHGRALSAPPTTDWCDAFFRRPFGRAEDGVRPCFAPVGKDEINGMNCRSVKSSLRQLLDDS